MIIQSSDPIRSGRFVQKSRAGPYRVRPDLIGSESEKKILAGPYRVRVEQLILAGPISPRKAYKNDFGPQIVVKFECGCKFSV